jgi:hypothetical protein
MPIIINELEVIAAQPPERPQPQSRAERENTPPPGPTPEDIYWAMRQLVARRLRVQAD